jgi:hypothetical protein
LEFRKQEQQYLDEVAQAAKMFSGPFYPGGSPGGQ